MTTPPIQTLTDELLGEIEVYANRNMHRTDEEAAFVSVKELRMIIAELRTLRAENASKAARIEELSTPYSRTCERMWALEEENAELRKDAGRLDWIDSQCEAYGFEDIHEGNRWFLDGPFSTIRIAIDAAIAMEQAK
jgi:hypothetical protein